jgi:hypothetical protein
MEGASFLVGSFLELRQGEVRRNPPTPALGEQAAPRVDGTDGARPQALYLRDFNVHISHTIRTGIHKQLRDHIGPAKAAGGHSLTIVWLLREPKSCANRIIRQTLAEKRRRQPERADMLIRRMIRGACSILRGGGARRTRSSCAPVKATLGRSSPLRLRAPRSGPRRSRPAWDAPLGLYL